MLAMPIRRETIASVRSFSEFDVAVDNMIGEVLTGDGVIVMVAAEVALTLWVSSGDDLEEVLLTRYIHLEYLGLAASNL
jgi:hypothetical protein